MLGYAIDAIEIDRFSSWHKYCNKTLLRIFTQNEIDYCCSYKSKNPERLAVRFAAKEAFYKAITPLLSDKIPFLTACKGIEVIKTPKGNPELLINWDLFDLLHKREIKTFCSLTHTKTTAIASIILL